MSDSRVEMPALDTGRLLLRGREPGDGRALFPTLSDAAAMRWWSRAPFTDEEEVVRYFAVTRHETHWRAWAMVRKGFPGAIGFVSVGARRPGVSEIGYVIASEHGGLGLAREAVAGVIDHLFAVEGQRRVMADVDPDNLTSLRLLEALGFRREGLLRAEWETHIGVRDSVILGLLASEWRARIAAPGET